MNIWGNFFFLKIMVENCFFKEEKNKLILIIIFNFILFNCFEIWRIVVIVFVFFIIEFINIFFRYNVLKVENEGI